MQSESPLASSYHMNGTKGSASKLTHSSPEHTAITTKVSIRNPPMK